MSTYLILFVTFVTASFMSCRSTKINFVKDGKNIRHVAINNAILDFSNSCKLYKDDSVFSISFDDSVFF
jgi:hypothetical protein